MKKSLLFVLLILLFTTACGISQTLPTETPTAAVVENTPEPTATPLPESRSLSICLGQEPNSLYPLGELNAAAQSVLAAVNDGPIDSVGYDYQPVIITQIPSIENGDAEIVSVPVQTGDEVVDASGSLVTLGVGVKVRPASCRADDCVITYDGSSPLQMDQMIVRFTLRTDLTWSDGTPVTTDDSVYAYELASDPNALVESYLAERTETYEAADAQTLQWWGKPGFIDPTYFLNMWAPAPRHAWSEFGAQELPEIDLASRTPIGWGPYKVEEWLDGDHITLSKNPYYFLAADGYPKFDTLTFRFIEDPNMALTELVAGRCDILDPTIRLDAFTGLLKEMEAGEQARAFFVPGSTIEWLGLGITPASYDNGYNVGRDGDRQNYFGDPLTRQGIAYCLDRESVVKTVMFGLSSVPATYLPVGHPAYDANLTPLTYKPETGISLLEQAGWRDVDGDPATPRTAANVQGVTAGTPLLLNYYTTTSTQRRQVADILETSLAECGIGLKVQYFEQNELFAPGPEGPLFGRKFDLAQYAMGVEGVQPACGWFAGSEIPSASNAWTGTNLTAFKDEDYDAACSTAQLALPDDSTYLESYLETQAIFMAELPSIPLYYRLRIAASAPDVCRFDLDATANPLWNIEAFDKGESCAN